jgi:PAS domain S-box-containing protein
VAREDRADLNEWPAPGEAMADGGEAVRASEQRYRREFGPMPYGMFVVGLGANQPCAYLAVNDAFCQMTGYSRRELAGADFLGDIHPEQRPAVETCIQKIISGETDEIEADTRLVCKDGEISNVHLTGSAIQPPEGARYLTMYVQDSAGTQQAHAEIKRLELELQRFRRLDSLGQLADGIAHDFNNMLTVISNFASLVRDEVTIAETTDSATRWGPVRWDVEQIEDAADRAKRLIRHLLAFARREQTPPTAVDMSQLVNDTTGLLGEVLGEHVRVVTEHGQGTWSVETDPGLLQQAIINIALNARDAMPSGGQLIMDTSNFDTANPGARIPGPGGTTREDETNLAELIPGHYVQIRITDTGAGMDALTAERAFEPFFTTKSGDQAAGLGLSAVRRMAGQAGGKAWLHSEPGKGTTVTIMLPASSGSAVTGTTTSQAEGMTEYAGSVLVVDDEASIRDVAHRVLTCAGYQVITASNGQEALAVLADPEAPADLLLTDVVMPGVSGEPFAARAQAIRPGIRVLYMSGYGREGPLTESWPDIAEQVIAKPFSRAALLARVSEALAVDVGMGTQSLAAAG